jgi:hypothetical protein
MGGLRAQISDGHLQGSLTLSRHGQLVRDALHSGFGSPRFQEGDIVDEQAWRCRGIEALAQLYGINLLGQDELSNLIPGFDAHCQSGGEIHLGPRMETLRHCQSDTGSPKEPFKHAHQVAVTDQPKIALFGKTKTDFVSHHGTRMGHRGQKIEY